jgi:topoisomerase-4 subunit A
MAYVKKLFSDNFLYYASYVIKDRAIPDLEDGLKPVQRRILHSLFDMDDGKYHKVANVMGHCMKYHPHGDQSIGSALVVLANKELFIDKQGNFGNIFTGDEASAPRYIECRASPLAKEVFYNPKTTEYEDSYDGRNREPVHFPAKLPVILLMGAEGIAVGMSTKILPHNPVEVIKAEIACLQGKKFEVYPDFPTGGIIDLSEYSDGNGKLRVRAKLDTSDPKKIVISEIPYSSTTESLIASVEAASRSGQLKIASISDFTTDKVEIEIRLQRGVYTQEVVDALYAFTECEQSISCNFLVIQGEKPVITTASEVVRYHSGKLLTILRRELEIERGELLDELHARTLERIFIEERVYKKIESQRTQETVNSAVKAGLEPFKAEIGREVVAQDIERLLKIPIRRISLYDIEKARDEMRKIAEKLKEVEFHLAHLVDYAVDFLKGMAKKLESAWPRRSKIESFSRVDAKEVARRDVALRYDSQSGYIGTAVSTGDKVLEVSAFDRILIVRRNGMYSVVPVPEKLFVDTGLLWVTLAVKEEVSATVLTSIYKVPDSGYPYIKRCSIEGWILEKDYSLIPDGSQMLMFSTEKDFSFTLTYAPKPRTKKNEEEFKTKGFIVKGLKASGVRLATREVLAVVSAAKRTSPTGVIAPDLSLESDLNKIEPNQPLPARASKPAVKIEVKPTAKPEAKKPAKKAVKLEGKPRPAPSRATTTAPASAPESTKAVPANPTDAIEPPHPESTQPPPEEKNPKAPEHGQGLLAALARKKAELQRNLLEDEDE